MVKQYIISKATISHLKNPYIDSIDEFKTYFLETLPNNQQCEELLTNIAKSIELLKTYVNNNNSNEYLVSLFYSEIAYTLYCIKQNYPDRYFHTSLRTLIETFLRLNTPKSESTVVDSIFESFKDVNRKALENKILLNEFFSRIKQMYSDSSGILHGSPKANFNIVSYLSEIDSSDNMPDTLGCLQLLQDLLQMIKRFYLISDVNLEILKHDYSRRMILVKYLLTKAETKSLLS